MMAELVFFYMIAMPIGMAAVVTLAIIEKVFGDE